MWPGRGLWAISGRWVAQYRPWMKQGEGCPAGTRPCIIHSQPQCRRQGKSLCQQLDCSGSIQRSGQQPSLPVSCGPRFPGAARARGGGIQRLLMKRSGRVLGSRGVDSSALFVWPGCGQQWLVQLAAEGGEGTLTAPQFHAHSAPAAVSAAAAACRRRHCNQDSRH
jgi:hypothetical protein